MLIRSAEKLIFCGRWDQNPIMNEFNDAYSPLVSDDEESDEELNQMLCDAIKHSVDAKFDKIFKEMEDVKIQLDEFYAELPTLQREAEERNANYKERYAKYLEDAPNT